jgi:hypothetical protein
MGNIDPESLELTDVTEPEEIRSAYNSHHPLSKTHKKAIKRGQCRSGETPVNVTKSIPYFKELTDRHILLESSA